jgi:hypothetical protein
MAMGDIVDAKGGKQILTGNGWVPLTPELETASRLGFFGAFTQNAVEMATFGLYTPDPGLEEVSPLGSKFGTAAGVVGPLAGPLFRGAVAGVRAVRGGRAAVGGVEGAAAERAAGGTFFKTEQGFLKRPSDIGPEALRGTLQSIEAGVGSLPLARMGVDLINTQKRKVMGGKVGRAMGLSDDEIRTAGGRLRPADVEPALDRIDQTYNASRNLVSEKVTTQQVTKLAKEALEEKFISPQELARWSKADAATGDTLLDLRSAAREAGRRATTRMEKVRADEIVDAIQELIKDASRGTEQFVNIGIADREWKVWSAVSKGGVVNGEGWLNLNSLKSNLSAKRSFGTRVGRGGRREGLRPVEVDMFDAIDELGPINFQIPSSGTAERQIAASMIGTALGIQILGVN